MNKWITEDWQFTVTVTQGEAKSCRIGLEAGDSFTFEYATPAGFCPRAMADLHTWCEVIRCGGSFTYRGSSKPYSMSLSCPCGCIEFLITAAPVNRT